MKKNSGFTLVEIVVTVAVISAIALVVMNQNQLVSKSRITSNNNSVINGLRAKIIGALADEKTCTANFPNWPLTAQTPGLIKDSEGATIIATGSKYGRLVAASSSSDSDTDNIVVNSIATIQNPTNADQLLLTIKFGKLSKLGGSAFGGVEQVDIPLNIIVNGVPQVTNCFADATLSIQTAIQLSCDVANVAPGNTAYYDPTANPPYGTCNHIANANGYTTGTPGIFSCPAGKFINKVGINLSGGMAPNLNAFEFDCAAFQAACSPGQILTGFNDDGTVNCATPFPNCGANQIMIKSSGAGAPFVCAQTDVGCSGMQAIKSINPDGTMNCQNFYPPQTCAGTFIQSSSPGAVACGDYVKSITCPFGSYIDRFDATGQPLCSPWINVPTAPCGANQAIVGFDAAGTRICQNMDKRVSCAGTISPNPTHTFLACIGAGGAVNNRYAPGNTDAFCIFGPTVSSCPAGWSPCNNQRYTTNNGPCSDTTSSNCTYSATSLRTAPGAYFLGSYSPASVTCVNWTKILGPWQRTCYTTNYAPIFANTIQVGCY